MKKLSLRLTRIEKRQRFYARNAVNTTLSRLSRWQTQMTSFWTDRAQSRHPNGIQPTLTSFADEVCATVARIFAYVGTLALFAILGIHAWNQYRLVKIAEPAVKAGWTIADRPHPAFAVSQADQPHKSETYVILRHPEGGRKDILRWKGAGEKPVAELEIYRPGGEFDVSLPIGSDLTVRMPQIDASELETAGIIESKFGTVALLRRIDAREDTAKGTAACLGFFKRIEEANLQISGWSCQGANWPARRTAIGCMLDRLTLSTAGNEPRLAELFARAELKRDNCAPTSASDWVTGAETPKLRGTL
jgi:hypothetical protein